MQNLVGSSIGLGHLICSLLSILFGTFIIILRKGTKTHKRVGYLYVIGMMLTNLTAFMIYRLYGSFGPFHIAAILSLFTTLAGMIPIWVRRPAIGWKFFHFTFMYWSVVGLYMALFAELLTRIPSTPFFTMVGIAMTIVMLIGLIYYRKMKDHWKKVFGLN